MQRRLENGIKMNVTELPMIVVVSGLGVVVTFICYILYKGYEKFRLR